MQLTILALEVVAVRVINLVGEAKSVEIAAKEAVFLAVKAKEVLSLREMIDLLELVKAMDIKV